jgi:hypothetical protein
MGVYVTQHKQMIVQDDIADMQANLRAASEELATKIRLAGYNLHDMLPPIQAYNTNPDTIVIAYDTGILDDVTIEHSMPNPSVELRCDGHDITGLHDGDWVYIYDPFADTGEVFLCTQAQHASSHIQHRTMRLTRRYPAGSLVMIINIFKYYIDNSDPDHPNLMIWTPRNGAQIYAENITDLDLRYVLSNGSIVDVPFDPKMVREVLIDIDARTDNADDEFMSAYRTRSISTRAYVRNLAGGSL